MTRYENHANSLSYKSFKKEFGRCTICSKRTKIITMRYNPNKDIIEIGGFCKKHYLETHPDVTMHKCRQCLDSNECELKDLLFKKEF